MQLGDGWYPLPLDRDPGAFADEVAMVLREEAPALVGHELDAASAEALAAEFRTMTEHAQRTSAYAAALYRPVFDAPMLALAEVHLLIPTRGSSLHEWVVAQYAADDSAPLRRDIAETDLPVGPSVRVHELSGRRPGEPEAPIVESVSHVLFAPGGEVALRATTSWTTPDDGELVALADELAATISFS